MPSAAEEAIARAKAIAARLAGTAAVSATTPQASAAPVPPPAGVSSTYYAPATSTAAAPASAASSAGVVQVDAATAKAAEEALAMAFGPSTGAGAGAPAAKRKRWGDDGDAAAGAATANGSTAEDPAAKKPALDPAVARTADLAQQALLAAMSGGGAGANAKVTRKLPIPTEQFPGYNFVGLLIGPGGSKQRELVQRAGGNVKISVRGDSSGGSSGAEPLHVLLEGSKDCVDKADEMISELLKDPKKADEEKARQLGGLKGAMPAAGVDGQYGPPSSAAATTSSYTPKPVASLLGLGGGAASGHYGPTPGSTTFVEEKIGVPNGVVGFIIGRGGESILSMQRRSGCKVQIQKEFEMAPGSTQRVITLTADTKDSVDMARGIIEGMVKEKMLEQQQKNAAGSGGGVGGPGLGAGAGGGPGVDPQTARMNQAIADGHAVVKLQVRLQRPQ